VAPLVSDRALPIWIGVDASVKRDSTAIVAVSWDADASKVRLVFHRIFQPSAKEPLNFEATIAHTVRDLTTRFAVRGVFYDPFQMAAVAQGLQRVGVPMREVPQTPGTLTEIGTNLFELIKARGLVAYPDAALRLAILRAVAVETPRGWKISKEKASHKIDVVVALAMAAHAAVLGSRVPPQPAIHVPPDLSTAACGIVMPGSMGDRWSPPSTW
jgi:phage terminase large subunit-like protein